MLQHDASMPCSPSWCAHFDDMCMATCALGGNRATIQQLNTVRKHLSAIKGGQLAVAAHPAKVVALVLSDVVGDHLDVIASGPTVCDTSTFADALAVLKSLGIESLPSAALKRLQVWRVPFIQTRLLRGRVCAACSLRPRLVRFVTDFWVLRIELATVRGAGRRRRARDSEARRHAPGFQQRYRGR